MAQIEVDDNATDILTLAYGIKALAGRVCKEDPEVAYPDIFMDIARMLSAADFQKGYELLAGTTARLAKLAIINGATLDEIVTKFRAFLVQEMGNLEPS